MSNENDTQTSTAEATCKCPGFLCSCHHQKPAGEHDTGTLDLTGQGNPDTTTAAPDHDHCPTCLSCTPVTRNLRASDSQSCADQWHDPKAAKIEGALYAAMERGSIGYSSTQRRPAVEFLAPIITELITEARQQTAEQIAAKGNEIAEQYQATAIAHRDIVAEIGSGNLKGESHTRTAHAFRNKADGAWAVTHAARQIGGQA